MPLAGIGQLSDPDLLFDINSRRSASGDGLAISVTRSAYAIALLSPAAEYGVYLRAHNTVERQHAIKNVVSSALTAVVVTGLKYGIDRQRPYEDHAFILPYEKRSTPSFPSGHTSIAFSQAMIISLHHRKWYVVAPAFAWAGAVGYSRLYLGAHYPTDVLAGAAMGILSGWLTNKVNSRWETKKGRRMRTDLNPTPQDSPVMD